MAPETLLVPARDHVRRWFAKRMPRHLHFHDLEHTLSVARAAVGIAQGMRLPPADVATVELAALFHDTGYALAREGHEEHSAELATAFLTKHKAPARLVARVRALIMATRSGARPRGVLQQVIRDADGANAGQVDFMERSRLLHRELEHVRGRPIPARDWLKENLAYLEAHRFHTPFAQRRYGRQKALNLAALRAQLRRDLADEAAMPQDRFIDRDLSWLSFNDRVLQEAKDPTVPLLERLKFLAICSRNLDEFYRVRVASLRGLAKLKKADRARWEVPPEKRIERMNRRALAQQRELWSLYRRVLLPALARHGIRIVRENALNTEQKRMVRAFVVERVMPHLHTIAVRPGNAPLVEDRKPYLVCALTPKGRSKRRLMLLNIPSEEVGRFIVLPPAQRGNTDLIFLDDALRLCLDKVFTGHKVQDCHAIKLARDAELYLDEEFAPSVKEKVRHSLRKRSTGVPSRFLYDDAMSHATLRAMRELLGLAKGDLVPGGRYHDFSDLMQLPVSGRPELRDKPWPPVVHPAMRMARNAFPAIARQDMLWHFPYHDLSMLTDWLADAARDPAVKHMAITLYRVAQDSSICAALLDAAKRGKQVTVFVEVQDRFDERANLYWGDLLEKAGARVFYGYEDVKVHAKLCMIERVERGRRVRYAYLGTGNFNERTGRTYSDMALLTARPAITREVAEVFTYLADRAHRPALKHLLLAPMTLRTDLEALVDKEIELAQRGRPAEILLKLNNLEDHAMIRKLYVAARAGVRVRVIVRGICCLVTGPQGAGPGLEAISIVDRYLEHSRVYLFGNDGDPLVYLSSADWMGRNLDRRVEVAVPVLDPAVRRQVIDLMEIQWADRTKARLIDARQTNPYRPQAPGERRGHAQADAYAYFKRAAMAAPKARREPTKKAARKDRL